MEENKAYLLFNGYYDVAAASEMLSMYNINNRIVRAPVTLSQSCSYAILVSSREEKMSRYILRTKGIKSI